MRRRPFVPSNETSARLDNFYDFRDLRDVTRYKTQLWAGLHDRLDADADSDRDPEKAAWADKLRRELKERFNEIAPTSI